MKEKVYLPRIIDDILPNYLEAFGAVLIVGPKWCGKTTTAMRFAKSDIKMQDVEKSNDYLKLAELAPKRLLAGEPPHLIDEWQMAPVLWDAVRNEVDVRGCLLYTSYRSHTRILISTRNIHIQEFLSSDHSDS